MSIHAVAESSVATTDAQVIEEMAADVLADIARMHADGLAALTAIAESPAPVRVELPPVAEQPAEVEPVADVEPVEITAEADETDDADDLVVRIAEPVWIAPQPRGRHLSEAVTDEIAVQTAA